MENEVKVFNSEISRVDCEEENHLYDLLKIVPAIPVLQRPHNTRNEIWEFTPSYDKLYIPKTRNTSKLKVKTVFQIRTLFESDIWSYLPDDLEKQQNYLLRKIRDGSSNEERTRKNAINIFNADNPISRSAWQMLTNINPERHNHPKQFVMWNGKCIQVNGSRGGKNKWVCNYDLKNNKITTLKNTSNFKSKVSKSRLGLLRNSLNVKFKPGPLGMKKFLDASHHKYQMGDIELIKLPTPVLEISTAYGNVLEPAISNFINDLRGENGFISQKFAEFAVSVLGTIENNAPAQLDKKCCITFDLNYKCDQNRILMRRNVAETMSYTNVHNDNTTVNFENKSVSMQSHVGNNCNSNVAFYNESNIEIKQIMDEMLNSVEISLKQDSMYSTEDEFRETIEEDCKDLNAIRDKPKRRYCELGKLDVTIIKLPDSSEKDYTKPCGKSFCTLGCVCESIDCIFSLKQHCGVLECMFGCKCETSKYKDVELLKRDCSDIIPGLLNLDNEINSHLAKEEQKFHQTVIVSGEKSIVLKSRKRNSKSSKRYAEFYSKQNLKSDDKIKKKLTIYVNRLNCENIEPLCMVHNLYKCFCKGKFTESSVYNVSEINTIKTLNDELTKVEKEITEGKDSDTKTVIRPRLCRTYEKTKRVLTTASSEVSSVELSCNNADISCARTVGYNGRKYSNEYYTNTNSKISEMEKNDIYLRKRMLRLVNSATGNVTLTPDSPDASCESLNNDEVSNDSRDGQNEVLNNTNDISENNNQVSDEINKSGEFSYPFANSKGKSSLKTWLETSYKSYKERLGQGTLKSCLDAPKKGKAALQSWDFILSRYRERKNIFFVSKQEPFRTFLAVNDKHPFFANCINIDDIRFADLPKYPLIIRNLVTNATDSENSFCILRGWEYCWELIGSAVKVIERVAGNQSESNETFDAEKAITQDDNDNDDWIDQRTSFSHEPMSLQEDEDRKQIEGDTHSERSKWFVMIVENDFTEIQFYKRGFYVTYDGIHRSICLSRISGKTVRLSSQICADKTNTHQFGIYAIPCTSECCVFIGPYEVNEPLGIEVVKTFLVIKNQKKTRGVWITTNKVDNMKVIEHPLSFMPSASVTKEAIETLDSGSNTSTNNKRLNTLSKQDEQGREVTNLHTNITQKEIPKVVKPIKIRRTNGFYHLSKNFLQKIPPNKTSSLFINKPTTSVVSNNSFSMLKKYLQSEESGPTTSLANLKPIAEVAPQVNDLDDSSPNPPIAYIRPVAEIAPQIKITHVYSESGLQKETGASEKDNGSNMLILKPEEINEKILGKTTINDEMGTDVEKFLETCTICIAPDEVFVISDGEDEDIATWKDVWIQCCNVDNFGCIRGRINDDKLLSFEFPGFKYSDFYTEIEAFEKINQVLARKIYVPKNFKLQWQVIQDKERLTCDMLTPKCLEEKRYLIIKLREKRVMKEKPKKDTSLLKTYSKSEPETGARSTDSLSEGEPLKMNNKTAELLKGLEQTSRELEHQSAVLWNEAVTKRNEIFGSLSVPDNLKAEMTETLQGIMTMNEQ